MVADRLAILRIRVREKEYCTEKMGRYEKETLHFLRVNRNRSVGEYERRETIRVSGGRALGKTELM